MDCGQAKVNPVVTGTFLCKVCQESQFNKLRELTGGEVKVTQKEKVEELMDEGLSPKEIAEKADIGINSVYNYRSEIKKDRSPVAPVNKSDTDWKKAYQELLGKFGDKENKIAELGANIEELNEMVSDREKELIEIRQDNHNLRKEITNISNTSDYQQEYEQEKKAHQALFDYLASIK